MQHGGVGLVERPETLWSDAPPALVPILAPPVLERRTHVGAETCSRQALGKPACRICTAFIPVECQHHGLHLGRKPVRLRSSANQSHHLLRLKARRKEGESVECPFDQDDTTSKLIECNAKPARRVGLNPTPWRSRLLQ